MPKEWTTGLALLPDENGAVRLADGLGLVRSEETDLAAAAAGMMRAPEADGPDVLATLARARRGLAAGETAAWRGLTAFVLLADTWKEPCAVETVHVDAETSPLCAGILASAGRAALDLVLVKHGERQALLGYADAELAIVPPAQPERFDDLLPARVTWFDAAQGAFGDPTALLNQRDRRRLAARLRLLSSAEPVVAFADALEAADRDSADDARLDMAWETRMRAMIGLGKESAFAETLVCRPDAYRDVRTDNPVLTALGVRESTRQARPEQATWLWNGLPFARTNEQIGLEPVPGGEEHVLGELREEETRLRGNSARYRRELTERLGWYQLGAGARLTQAASQQLTLWQAAARDDLTGDAELSLTWPWPVKSPAVRLLLTEALGEALGAGAAGGLVDRLTLMQGGSLNDSLLDSVCMVELDGAAHIAVPPLGAGIAECVARYGLKDRGLLLDSISLTPGPEGAVTATMVLAGERRVRLTRVYRADEQERWTAEEVPQLALWPSVPLESDRWKQYYVSVRGRADVGLLDRGAWTMRRNEEGATVVRTDHFPGCMSLHRGGLCLGAVIYQAPVFRPEDKGEMIGALDLGLSGVSMAVSIEGQTLPVEMPSLWRALLRGEGADLTAEPLPVWPLGPVLPGCVTLTGDAPDPKPLLDGRVLPQECLENAAERDKAHYDLLWRTDDAGRKARRLMLREALLLACFHGVMNGAQSVRWRVALPSAVSETGRAMLLDEVRELTEEAAWETSLPLSGYAAEGLRGCDAAGLWLREGGMRSSFALLDIGAGSVSASVWLRGVERPVAEFCLGGGVPAQLVTALMEQPDCLRADFAGLSGLPVAELALGLEKAQSSMHAWEKSRLLMDYLLGQRLPETARWMNARCAAGKMTYLQALLLLEVAGLMTNVGMMLEKLYRDPALNDHLPQELTLCLCGRGSLLVTTLDDALRYQLTRFLRLGMSADHPIRAIRITTSGALRMEAAQGLCRPEPLPIVQIPDHGPAIAPVAVAARYFLMQFSLCFPQASALLFPGMIGAGNMLSPAAEAMIDATAARTAGTDEEQLMGCLNALCHG